VSPLVQHVGLGPAARTVDVEVWWPASNTRQRFAAVPKNRWIQIEEFAADFKTMKRPRVSLGGQEASR